jgi:hypothetical protein
VWLTGIDLRTKRLVITGVFLHVYLDK